MSIFRDFFRKRGTTSILAMSAHDAWCHDELARRRADAERVNASSQIAVDPSRPEGADSTSSGGSRSS